MSLTVAGLDLGGTGSRAVVLHGDEVVASRTVFTGALGEGAPEARLARLAALVADLVPPGATLGAVGIGASGPVDRDAGVIDNVDTLAAFSGFPLVAELRSRLGVPIAIDNDAVTAAVAEARIGAGRGIGRVLVVTLGTGIGAAFLVDGMPFRGPGGAHPEAGHIPIAAGGPRCYCGAEGCWEQLASRTALQALLRPLLPVGTTERDLLSAAAARAGEPGIRDAFNVYGALVGRGLSVLQTLYRPEITVLGGRAAAHLPVFRVGMTEALHRSPPFDTRSAVRATLLGDEAGALGAAFIAQGVVDG